MYGMTFNGRTSSTTRRELVVRRVFFQARARCRYEIAERNGLRGRHVFAGLALVLQRLALRYEAPKKGRQTAVGFLHL